MWSCLMAFMILYVSHSNPTTTRTVFVLHHNMLIVKMVKCTICSNLTKNIVHFAASTSHWSQTCLQYIPPYSLFVLSVEVFLFQWRRGVFDQMSLINIMVTTGSVLEWTIQSTGMVLGSLKDCKLTFCFWY